MKHLLILFLIVSFSVSKAQKTNVPHRPKIVVGIVVENMRYDYITKLWTVFDETGFRRLIDYGSNCKSTYLDYAYTQSAPGFATIATGCNPSDHGIIAERWYNRLLNSEEFCVGDPEFSTVGGKPFENNSSPKKLLTTTLGDQMKIAFNKQSKVFSISLYPESSVLTSGYLADGAFWLDLSTGEWCTSRFYMDELPTWLVRLNNRKQPDVYMDASWVPVQNESSYFVTEDDMNEYEIGLKGRTYFPYSILKLADNYRKYKILTEIPHGNTLVKNAALELIKHEKLGKDFTPDLLTICFSAGKGVVKNFGVQSKEIQDVYLRLDKEIGHLLKYLDEQFGKENCLVYLTSSSGTADYPKYTSKFGLPGGYFKHMQAVALLKSYLNAVYGKGEWVKYYNKQQIYLDRSLIEKSNLSLREVQTIAANFLIQFSGVANVLTSTALSESNFTNGAFSKMQNSFSAKRSGDLFLILDAGWMEQTVNSCTDNNSPYIYDTHVPLIWWGWKIQPNTLYRTLSLCDVVPTIATFLNVEPPSKASGNVIWELIENKN